MKFIRNMGSGLALLAAAALAQAAPVTVSQTLGEINSFNDGSGIASQASGVAFDSFSMGFGSSGDLDLLVDSSSLSFSLVRAAGTVTDARLVLRTGGFGLYGPVTVKFNGTVVGTLTDGDAGDPLDPFAYNDESAHVDVFDLLVAGAAFATSGVDLIEIIVPQTNINFLDWGAVDYAILQVTSDPGDPGGGGTTPEPASLALAALGLIAAGAARRRAAG